MVERGAGLFLLLVSLLTACTSGQNVPDELLDLSQPERRARAQTPAPAGSLLRDCNARVLSCGDCHTVIRCTNNTGELQFLSSSLCPESAPYCDVASAKCVARLPESACLGSCSVPARLDRLRSTSAFRCYEGEAFQGYYPAADSCDRYYVCSRGVAYVYNCPSGQHYDHASATCVSWSSAACTPLSVQCELEANRNSYVLYNADPSVFAYCDFNGTAHISKCLPSYRMDPEDPTRPCQPHCSGLVPGRFAIRGDPRSYKECEGTGFLKQRCPPGMAFSQMVQRCVIGNIGDEEEGASFTSDVPTTTATTPHLVATTESVRKVIDDLLMTLQKDVPKKAIESIINGSHLETGVVGIPYPDGTIYARLTFSDALVSRLEYSDDVLIQNVTDGLLVAEMGLSITNLEVTFMLDILSGGMLDTSYLNSKASVTGATATVLFSVDLVDFSMKASDIKNVNFGFITFEVPQIPWKPDLQMYLPNLMRTLLTNAVHQSGRTILQKALDSSHVRGLLTS